MNEEIEKRLELQKMNSCYFNTLEAGECKKLCSSGACNADCCGCVPILEGYYKKLKKFIPDSKEFTEIHFTDENGYSYIKPFTSNFKCVFLSDSNECLIYNSNLRPDICKRYGEDPREPLFACVHINKEVQSEIEQFCSLYLESKKNQVDLFRSKE